MKKVFQARLAILCGSQKVTEFARKLGIPQATVDRYLKGQRSPNGEAVVKICRSAGVTADWLLGLSDVRDHTDATARNPPAEPPSPSAPCQYCTSKDAVIAAQRETIDALKASVGFTRHGSLQVKR